VILYLNRFNAKWEKKVKNRKCINLIKRRSRISLTTTVPLIFENERNSKDLTHGLFRFPGRFHPPLITHLIELHPDAKIIGDLMVGSGTVAVEATAQGIDGIYSDIDPLSCLLTRAKSRPVDPNWLIDTIQIMINNAQPFAKRYTTSYEAQQSIDEIERSTLFKAPPDVFHWFQPYVIVNICKILQEVSKIECNSRRRDALLAVIAASIRRLSRADPNTSSGLEVTKVRLEALDKGLIFDINKVLTQKSKILAQGYRDIQKTSKKVNVQVIQHDARDYSALCSKHEMWPDLVITSPCYISAIEYWRRHKLEYSWLGLVPPENLSDVKRTFLGMSIIEPEIDQLSKHPLELYNKLNNIGRKRDALVLARYFIDSSKWLNEVATVLRHTDGTCYVVVGCNTNHGITLNTPLALQEIASDLGLNASVFMKYSIKNSYMQYPINGERILEETVLKIDTG